MNTLVSINKKICSPQQACVSVFDHGFLFGDSVYENIRTYKGIPFALSDHLKRLAHSAQKIQLPLPYTLSEIAQQIIEILKKAQNKESTVRIIVTRGEGKMTLHPESCSVQNLILICLPFTPYHFPNGVKLAVVNTKRNLKEAMDPNIKSGNYLNNVLAIIEAKNQQAFEAIMLNSKEHLAEGTTSNIFLVKKECLLTPNLASGILSGITREIVMQLAQKIKIPIEERAIKKQELFSCQECFITSTTKEIMPVQCVDANFFPSPVPGALTGNLIKAFKEKINEFLLKYPNLEIFEEKLSLK